MLRQQLPKQRPQQLPPSLHGFQYTGLRCLGSCWVCSIDLEIDFDNDVDFVINADNEVKLNVDVNINNDFNLYDDVNLYDYISLDVKVKSK